MVRVVQQSLRLAEKVAVTLDALALGKVHARTTRKLTENLILKEVSKQISSPEMLRRILNKVEKEVAKTYSDVPDLIRQKEHELCSEKRRLANFVEFIAEGRGNQTIDKALQETENKAKVLEMEFDGLRRS